MTISYNFNIIYIHIFLTLLEVLWLGSPFPVFFASSFWTVQSNSDIDVNWVEQKIKCIVTKNLLANGKKQYMQSSVRSLVLNPALLNWCVKSTSPQIRRKSASWSGPKPRTCALHMLDERCYISILTKSECPRFCNLSKVAHHQPINACRIFNARRQLPLLCLQNEWFMMFVFRQAGDFSFLQIFQYKERPAMGLFVSHSWCFHQLDPKSRC